MNHYLIVCRTVTQAQQVGWLLDTAGISHRIFRTPTQLGRRGCSYSVRIREKDLRIAQELMHVQNLIPMAIYLQSQHGYSEVHPDDLL